MSSAIFAQAARRGKKMELLLHLTLYNLVASIYLYASLAYNPRMWLHRMPPEVVAKVPGKTPEEKRMLAFVALPFLGWILGYPIIYVAQHQAGFLANFLVFCAFFAGFAIWDTLVLDLLIFCHLTPGFIIIPGTSREDYANMKYHLVSGAKGIVIALVFSGILAAIATLVIG
jgi:hypothetical protein